jgi:guanyl-specific ribonuclease Sa
MKKKVTWLGLSLLLAAAMLLASCGSASTTSAQTSATTTAAVTTSVDTGLPVLTVTEGSTVKTYSMAALQALPSVSGNGGSLGKGGTITGPFPYQGVALSTLLNAVGGIAE